MKKLILCMLMTILILSMLIGVMPTSVFAYYEVPFLDGDSVDVCTEGKTYSLYTEDNLEQQNGTTFLYVVKSGDRYYTLGNPRYTEFKEVNSVYAVDITEYYNAQTNTFSGISNNVNVGAMQYQMNSGSYMYVNGDMLFALSVPFESEGNEWFDGGIRYYSPEETYSYSRPLWHANGDGTGYFYDSYIDWMSDSDVWVYGVLDLKYTGTNYVFALRDKSAEYTEAKNADPDNYDIGVNVTAYLYAAPCGHEQNVHGNADSPTCMEKGCQEYWYCRLCDTYFSNEEMTVAYEGFPEISALGHDWNGEKCNNCNRPVPVYSKVTNKTDFFALADDTMYVLVAEYEGRYYTPDSSILYSYVFDLDGDGYADIYNVDENDNGTPDVAEIDYDENGVFDLWDYPTEEERREYFDSICHGYLTDMIYGQTVGIPVKEITLNSDGTISHDAVKDALEFEMVSVNPPEVIEEYIAEGIMDEEDRWFYECVMQFVIPNTFINSPAFIPEDRPYDKLYPDEGDTYYWGVLFYNDRDSYYTYDWELDEYVSGLPFLDICKEGSIALSKSNSSFSPEWGSQLECLRLRDYNSKLSFVVGNDYDLEGSEYVDDANGGYWDTHDTQACVYLYASEQYDSHTCDFGNWTDNGDGTHIRSCKDATCGETENKPHGFDGGVETKAPTCTESGITTYTCTDCNYKKTENINTTDHEFGDWTPVDENSHKHSCTDCSASETDTHSFDEGVVTKAPTINEEGSRTYTCGVCNYKKTESIDKVDHTHNWTDWAEDGDNHTHVCKNSDCGIRESLPHEWTGGTQTKDPTCTEPGEMTYTCKDCDAKKTEPVESQGHTWTDWEPDGDVNHSRYCMSEICDAKESDPHILDSGEVTKEPTETAEGVKTYSCQTCWYTKEESIPKIVTIVENLEAGVTLDVIENSNVFIPAGTVIDVVEKPTEEIPDEVLGEIAVTADGAAKPLGIYDLSLLLDGAEIQPGGTVIVTLPAPDLAAEYDSVIVVYIAPDGSYEECKTTVNEDGTISFETDHFSTYAIIGIDKSAVKGGLPTGAIVGIVIGAVILLSVGVFAIVWFAIKKKSFADLIAGVNNKKNSSSN